MDIATILISSVLGAVGGFFLSYLNEKGKNFATKEDIAQITRLQTAVKAEFDAKHETLRSGLDRQLHIHKLTIEKEFEILTALWQSLFGLKLSTQDLLLLNPLSDSTAIQKLQEEWNEKYNKFYDEVEENRPFYAKEIYGTLREIIELATGATSFFRNSNLLDLPNAKQTTQDLIILNQHVDKACEEIRKRFFPETT